MEKLYIEETQLQMESCKQFILNELPTTSGWTGGPRCDSAAQDPDLSRSSPTPAERLKPNKPSHHRRKQAVEHPEVAVGVSLKHL